MKRFLLPIALLFTVPFCSSCIDDVTYKVEIKYKDPDDPESCHCHWNNPPRANRGKDYKISFFIDEGYRLVDDLESFEIIIGPHTLYVGLNFEYEDNTLTIFGNHITNDILINVTTFGEE